MTDQIDLRQLGENVRFLRQGKGWTLADLANGSGVGKAYISDLENGVAGKPNIQYVFALATALGVTLDQLVQKAVPTLQNEGIGRHKATALPPGLAELQKEKQLSPQEVEMLAQVNFRGSRPKDIEGWRFLYQTIRMLSERNPSK